jgi:hypothetical protein
MNSLRRIPMTTPKTVTRTFKFDRATKNTFRFDEVETPGELFIIGTLYVQRFAFNGSQPGNIKVTLELG